MSFYAADLNAQPAQPRKNAQIKQLPQVIKEIERLTQVYLDPAIRQRENRFIVKLNEGRLHYFKEDYRNAAMTLLELVETYKKQRSIPVYKDALFYLADSLYHIGNLRTATSFFEDVLRLKEPKMMPCALGRLIEISIKTERYDRVQLYFREARLAADRLKESHLYYLLGKYSYHVKKYRQAIQLWNRVSKLSSMYPQARYFRGVAFLELGKLKLALKAFQEVKGLDLELLKLQVAAAYSDPSTPEVDLTTGEVIASKKTKQSRVTGCTFRSVQERELEVKGWESVQAQAELAVARIFYERGQVNEALSAYLEIKRGSPLFRDAIKESVWVSIKKGDYQAALQQMDVQLIDEPNMLNDPFTRLLQGRLLSILGRFSDAQSIFGELRTRFETFKSSSLTPILVRARGQLAAYFQRQLERGLSTLNLEALLPRAALQFAGKELSSKVARELFVEISALERDLIFSKDTIRDLYWVLDSPNQSEIFPQLHRGLLRALELRYRMFTIQADLNDTQSATVRGNTEYKKLRSVREKYQKSLATAPQTEVQLTEREAKIEHKLMLSDLKIFRLRVGLKHQRAQLIALKRYLESARPDEIVGILSPQQRLSALKNVDRELKVFDAQVTRLESISDKIKRTYLRIGLFDEAFMIEERMRVKLAQALDQESEWLNSNGRFPTNQLTELDRAHKVIVDFQDRSLRLVSDNASTLRDQVAQEEAKIKRYELKLRRLSNQAQRLAGQMVALTFYRVLNQLDQLILEADAGLLDMIWTQKNQSTNIVRSERERRRIHFEVLNRDMVD
jgi:tetratricopeptide (TPR) repeat protein